MENAEPFGKTLSQEKFCPLPCRLVCCTTDLHLSSGDPSMAACLVKVIEDLS